MVGVKTLISESLTCSEDKLKEEEFPDSSTKNLKVKPNEALDDKREISSSVNIVAMEKWHLKNRVEELEGVIAQLY